MSNVLPDGMTDEFDKQMIDLERQTDILFGKEPPKTKPSFASHGGLIFFNMPLDTNGIVIETDDSDVDYTMESAQAKAISRAMARSNGNVSQAAKLLGVNRATIYNHEKAEEKKKKIA